MEREPENLEDIDRLLSNAKKALQEFEDGADWQRLLLRVRTASPAHPVLLGRFLFAGAGVLSVLGAIAVLLVPLVSEDLARTLAAFDEIVPYVPEELPALPTLLLALSVVMAVGWVFATYAATSLGRDTTMLPWEQKQHQKLVNEVTRLTTQKAVMERIKATPAGARPRIATPVPVAARGRQPAAATSALARKATPSGVARAEETPSYAVNVEPARPGRSVPPATQTPAGAFGGGGFGARPGAPRVPAPAPTPALAPPPEPEPLAAPVSAPATAKPGGLLARAKSAPGAKGAPPPTPPPAPPEPSGTDDSEEEIPALSSSLGYSPPVTAMPGRTAPSAPPEAGVRLGGVRLGAKAAEPDVEPAGPSDDFSDLVEVAPPAPEAPPTPPTAPAAESATDSGILGRARAGAAHLRSTPFGAAGRIRPPPAATASRGPTRAAPTTPPPEAESEPATRSGSPLGAAPRSGASVRTAARPGATPAADPTVRGTLPGGMFGTPPPITRQTTPPVAVSARAVPSKVPPADSSDVEEVTVMEEEDAPPPARASSAPSPARAATPEPVARQAAAPAGAPALHRPFPRFGPIQDPWLTEAIERAEKLQRAFPIQAHLEFSQEPHLPFTLVIARATPAMAVRAMVNFVEFLAQISTPPRARIELVNIPHLDRSFHKNVEAALEPYFQGNVEVEPNPGRVDILFTEPDPQWGEWVTLPVLDTAP
jgi:hypothetical protein